MKILKEHLMFLTFVFLGGLFLFPLMTFSHGFVKNDYALQMYPWSFAYSQALKQGELLLWTPLIQSGFPLFAEGQTGMLYLPNLILFSVFPFVIAYNLSFLAHFFLMGFFCYLFGKIKGMSSAAASFFVLSFLFGSAAGGLAGSFIALRSMLWLPASLYFFERYLKSKNRRWLFCLCFAQTQAWFSGGSQTAAYAAFFTVVYVFLRFFEEKKLAFFFSRDSLLFLAAIFLSVLMAAPQFWASFELAARSTRTLQQPEFILWGSVAPWSIATLFFPHWTSFLKSSLYIGILPLFFLLLNPNPKKFRIWWVLVFLTLLGALGRFNPLYWIFLEIPLVSLLRNPSKFLFFTAFFLSVLAAFSMDDFFRSGSGDAEFLRKKVFGKSIFFLIFSGAIGLAGWGAARWGEKILKDFGAWYVEKFIAQKSFHRGSAESYLQGIGETLRLVRSGTDFGNFLFWIPLLFGGMAVAFFYFAEKKKGSSDIFKMFAVLILLLDLFAYGKISAAGPWRDIGSFEAVIQREADGKWINASSSRLEKLRPNSNLLSGVPHAGIYAPLADCKYYQRVKGLGVVDDSFGMDFLDKRALPEKKELLGFLGVRYLLVDRGETFPGFRYLRADGADDVLYNENAKPDYWLEKTAGDFSIRGVRITERRNTEVKLQVETVTEALLVRRELFDGHWKAYIDGKEVAISRYQEIFQSIPVGAGAHTVHFAYLPNYLVMGLWVSLGGFVAAILIFILPLKGTVKC